MKNFLPVIRRSALFSGIDENETADMLKCLNATSRIYKKDEYIIRTGEQINSVGLVLSGSILVIKEDYWGNRNILAALKEGQLFAETFACSSGREANVSAVANAECDVMWLDVGRILHTCPASCSHHSRLIRNLLSDLAEKNLRMNEKITHMSKRTTREKLMSYLSSEAQRHGSAEFDIAFNRQQLADYLSVERSAMSAELSRLKSEALLESDKNHFRLYV